MEASEIVPDEIWRKIFEIGIQKSTLRYSDLCSLSISSKHFNRLSKENNFWSILLTINFPEKAAEYSSHSCSSMKTLYRFTNSLNAVLEFEDFTDNLLCLMDCDPLHYHKTLGFMCGENSPIFGRLRGKYAQIGQSIKDHCLSSSDDDVLVHFEEKTYQIISYRREALACEQELQCKIDDLLGRHQNQSDDDEDGENVEDVEEGEDHTIGID